MELTIQTKTEEPLLSRMKVHAEVTFEKETPSMKQVQAGLAKSLGKEAAVIAVDRIDTAYGLHKASVIAYAYKDAQVMSVVKKEGRKSIEKRKKQEEAEAAKKAEHAKKIEDEKKAKDAAKAEKSE